MNYTTITSDKSKKTALLCCIFGGIFGIHQFYETLDENPELLCEECSRHRTDQNPSSTPKGFYDLSI